MTRNNLTTESIQRNDYKTGTVKVTIVDDEPEYEILPDQAFDHIDFSQIAAEKNAPAILYHGSLCWRNPVSRQSLIKLRSSISAPIFVDLNIRQPWFDEQWLPEILSGIAILKLNKDELATVAGRELSADVSSVKDAAAVVKQKYKLKQLWVTLGSEGAWLFAEDDNAYFEAVPTIDNFVDAVGAGDAFASYVINGYLNDMSPQKSLQQAVHFAGKICGIQGATSEDRSVYADHAK